MERPNTILGLTTHLARSRWQQLSARGRFFVVVGGAVLSLAGIQGARMAMGGACCASSCASMRAAHETVTVTAEPAASPASDCPYASH